MPDVLRPAEIHHKVPASYSTNLLASIMEFGSQCLTEIRNHKCQGRAAQLQGNLDDLNEDSSKDYTYQVLITDLWQ